MKIFLRSKWFGPDGNRRRSLRIHEIPDEWEKLLPKGAVIVDDEIEPGPVNPKFVKAKDKSAKPAAKGSEYKL